MKISEKRGKVTSFIVVSYIALFMSLFFIGLGFADPVGPGAGNVAITKNETFAGDTSGQLVNISGGYIAGVNITVDQQNDKWKAFVGWVNGQLALSDASGDTIYDWALSVTTGKVYATRTSGTVSWTDIACANTTFIETENGLLGHSGVDDNITATFDDTTHNAFSVGDTNILGNTCPTLNTYISNVTQDTDFEEMLLDDGSFLVYATLLEDSLAGFDQTAYDFQMIVPQNATAGAANTPYYVFVEIT